MMGSQTKREAFHPRYLTLRIHSSILLPPRNESEELNSDPGANDILLPSEIVLGSTERNCDEVAKFEGTDNPHDGRVFRRDESGGISHIFMKADHDNPQKGDRKHNNNDENSSTRFDFVTSCASSQRIIVEPSADQIKEFGKRARARSEQQRKNRKGIQMIDDASLMAEQAQKQAKKRAASSKSTVDVSSFTANGGRKRQRQQSNSQNQKSRSTKAARKRSQLIWTPDVSCIPIPSKDDLSAYVMLHGLPIGSTFETIRKFFTGLVPQRILLLLSNQVDISSMDSPSHDDFSLYNLGNLVYTNTDVRVLVKFDSISAAGLAADRSGETILSKHVYGGDSKFFDRQAAILEGRREVTDQSPDAFSIGVTRISKELSLSLSKLSFDASTGVPIHDCLFNVESKVDPRVREILWASAEKVCRVAVDRKIKSAGIFIADHENRNEKTANDEPRLLEFAGYQKHAIHYNRLLRMQEDMLEKIQGVDIEDEATLSSDPVARLIANACTVIDDELDRIDGLLYQSRALMFV